MPDPTTDERSRSPESPFNFPESAFKILGIGFGFLRNRRSRCPRNPYFKVSYPNATISDGAMSLQNIVDFTDVRGVQASVHCSYLPMSQGPPGTLSDVKVLLRRR